MAKTISELEADRERLIARQKRLETRIAGAKSKQASTRQKKREEYLYLYGQFRLCFDSFHGVRKKLKLEEHQFESFKSFLWREFEIRNIEDEKKREKATKKVEEILKLHEAYLKQFSERYSRLIQESESKVFGAFRFKK